MQPITYKSFIDIATTQGVAFIHSIDAINNIIEWLTLENQLKELCKQLDFCNIESEKIICKKTSQWFTRWTSRYNHETGSKYFEHDNYIICVSPNGGTYNTFTIYKK